MEFAPETKAILRSATILALLCDSLRVEIGHLAADTSGENWEVPSQPRDIPFSPDVQRCLAAACREAINEGGDQISLHHLKLGMLATTGVRPEWGESREPLLAELIDNRLAVLLEQEGLDARALRKDLTYFLVRESGPDPDFAATEAGLQYYKYRERFADTHAPLLLLLGCVLSNAPVSRCLLEHGLTAQLLTHLLERPLETNLGELASRARQRCNPAARRSLDSAWYLGRNREMLPGDLLRGILHTDHQSAALLRTLCPDLDWGPISPGGARLLNKENSPGRSSKFWPKRSTTPVLSGRSPTSTCCWLWSSAEKKP